MLSVSCSRSFSISPFSRALERNEEEDNGREGGGGDKATKEISLIKYRHVDEAGKAARSVAERRRRREEKRRNVRPVSCEEERKGRNKEYFSLLSPNPAAC